MADVQDSQSDSCFQHGLACLEALQRSKAAKTAAGGPLDLEAACLAAADSLEKRCDWRQTWDILMGLAKHLGQGAGRNSERCSLSDETVLRMHAHVCMRSANLLGRVGSGIAEQDIVDLCVRLRAGLRSTLAIAATNGRKHLPTARKLLEWLVHVAISQSVSACPGLAQKTWHQAALAFKEGCDDKVLRALSFGRSCSEQLQLLQSVGNVARRGRHSPQVAQLLAEVMQSLMKLAPMMWAQLSVSEKEALCKALAAALETVTLCLPTGGPQQSIRLLDWADGFLERMAESAGDLDRGDASLAPLQTLFAVAVRARVQHTEEFRKADPKLLMMQRSDIFGLWHHQLLRWFEDLLGGPGVGTRSQQPEPDASGTLLRLAGLVDVRPGFCRHGMQAVEALRLQLPPSPASALLCLRQLQLHHGVLKAGAPATTAGWLSTHAAAFARLILSQSAEPDFASVLSRNGASRRLPLAAATAQLERSIQLQSTIDGLVEVGRLRLLQAQASQQAILADGDGHHKEPVRFVAAAFGAWMKALGMGPEALTARTPDAVAEALQPLDASRAGGSSQSWVLLLRDASDAAHLLESLDLHSLAFRALVICLACLCRRHGPTALWWRPRAPARLEAKPSCVQASAVLLYRMTAAQGHVGNMLGSDAEARRLALEWWKAAEAAWSDLKEEEGFCITAIQRLLAASSLPELPEPRAGGDGAWHDVLASAKGAVACVAQDEAGTVPQHSLHIVEALWALTTKTMHSQDRRGRCPGGSAIASQCAALTSLMLLLKGQTKAWASKLRQSVADAAEEPWLRWPSFRSGLLQLRVVSQASYLYKWLGEADLADACSQCGLQLMSQRLCGDYRWKLRFLCARARSAMAQPAPLPEVVRCKDFETLLAEIDELWTDRIAGSPGFDTEDPAAPPWEFLELQAEVGGKSHEDLCKNVPLRGREWSLRLRLLSARRQSHPQAWAANIAELLSRCRSSAAEPLPAPGRMLLTLAQAFFHEAAADAEGSSGDEEAAVELLARCARDIASCEGGPLLTSQQEQEVLAAAQGAASWLTKLSATLHLAVAAFRDALLSGDSVTLRCSAQLLLRAAEATRGADNGKQVPKGAEGQSRSRSPRRGAGAGAPVASWTLEFSKLCRQVVPLCSAVSLLFLTELRSMQREVEALSHARMPQYFFDRPHADFVPSVPVQKLASGAWLEEVGKDLSLAWLQVDWQGQVLRITRSLDAGLGLPPHSQLVSRQLHLPRGLLPVLQEDLRNLHALNGQKIRELWQREDKGTEAVRREFWSSRKRFDSELGVAAEKVQQEMLGSWRFLLAAWPKEAAAQQSLLDSVDSWMQEAASACQPTVRSAPRRGPPLHLEDARQRFLLALLFLDAEQLEASEIAAVMEALWPSYTSQQLRRLASSLKRYRCDCRAAFGANGALPDQASLLLYVDATMAQLPLEACSCLRHRKVVRGLAPNMTLNALAASREARPRTGYFIIDPAEDCTNMGDVRQLLASWSSLGQAWHGHTGRPMPGSKQVLEELCCNDVFIYLGHGERARQLLRQDELQLAGPSAKASSQAVSEESSQESVTTDISESESAKRGLRSILMLLGCSSVRLQRPSAQGRRGDFESFGLASSALLGGAPLVLGAQWDVLGGDLDRLASRLLQEWLRGGEASEGLLSALRALRPRCMLPNLTGAAVVCYGIPM